MQINEFIEATNRIEKYYDKEYSAEQRQIMYEELGSLSIERYKRVLAKCLRECKYIPKIADIIVANTELIDTGNTEQEVENVECKKCNGIGIILYKQTTNDGNRKLIYEYACRCNCKNGMKWNSKIPTYQEIGLPV